MVSTFNYDWTTWDTGDYRMTNLNGGDNGTQRGMGKLIRTVRIVVSHLTLTIGILREQKSPLKGAKAGLKKRISLSHTVQKPLLQGTQAALTQCKSCPYKTQKSPLKSAQAALKQSNKFSLKGAQALSHSAKAALKGAKVSLKGRTSQKIRL